MFRFINLICCVIDDCRADAQTGHVIHETPKRIWLIVYFKQLLGAALNPNLVKILFWECFQTFLFATPPFLKSLKTSVLSCAHPNDGQKNFFCEKAALRGPQRNVICKNICALLIEI